MRKEAQSGKTQGKVHMTPAWFSGLLKCYFGEVEFARVPVSYIVDNLTPCWALIFTNTYLNLMLFKSYVLKYVFLFKQLPICV